MSGSLRETVPLAGTGNALIFSSKNVPKPFRLDFPITDGDVGALAHADIDVSVAGRTFHETFEATPNQTYHFAWDGRDAYGRAVAGSAPISAKLTYWYKSIYAPPDNRFGDAPFSGTFRGHEFDVIPTRREVGLVTEWSGTADVKIPTPSPISGGWALADHATLDPISRELRFGTGGSHKLAPPGRGYYVETFAGNGDNAFAGDGGARLNASFRFPRGLATSVDGSLYVADQDDHRIRRIDPDGVVHTVAGTGAVGANPLQEGQALETGLFRPQGLAIDCEGSVFIEDDAGSEVRKVTPDGFIHTLPFRQTGYFEGLDGPAASAAIAATDAHHVAAGSNCRVYFGAGTGVIVRLDPSEQLTLVAGDPGNPSPPQFAEGTPAKFTHYDSAVGATSLAYEPLTGSVLQGVFLRGGGNYLDGGKNGCSIVRITPDGLQHLVAGDPALPAVVGGDGGPATKASLSTALSLTTLHDGTIVFVDRNSDGEYIVRRITTDGVISTIAGGGTDTGEGISALSARLGQYVGSLAVGPDDSIYVATPVERRIRRIYQRGGMVTVATASGPKLRRANLASAPPNELGAGETAVPDSTGSVVDVFDSTTGQHLRSFDSITGVLARAYKYDDASKLEGVSDTFGNATTYGYDAGLLTSVTSPFGLVTRLHYDNSGNLDMVTNPAGDSYFFTYQTGTQYLASLQDPGGNISSFAYDDLGQLTKDSDAAGGSKSLARSGSDLSPSTTVTTALGRMNQYSTTLAADRSVSGRSTQKFYGSGLSSTVDPDGNRAVTYQDGSTFTNTSDPDPRFGMLSPIASTFKAANGAQSSTTVTQRNYTLAKAGNPFDVAGFSETNTVDGNAYQRSYDATSHTLSTRSPTGRKTTTKLNQLGQVVETDAPGVAAVSVGYDSRGRPTTYQQGDRTTTITYDDKGFVNQVTDALGHTHKFDNDAIGRVLQTTIGNAINSPAISSSFDRDSNLSRLTPPSGAAHDLTYTPVNLLESYTPPPLNGAPSSKKTTFVYNVDRQLTEIRRPDGASLTFDYDATTARIGKTTLPNGDGAVTYGYDDAVTKELVSTSGPANTSFALGYTDGLVSSLAWSGAITGTVRKYYDGHFRLASESVDGFNAYSGYTYDADGLLISAGGVTITRDAASGRVTGTSFDIINDTRGYDSTYGELSNYTATSNAVTLLDISYTRDLLGRISAKTETINGTATTYAYGYDDLGRLQSVTTNGSITASYAYDANGNRTERQAGATTEQGSYDAQDRLTSYGSAQYTYTDAGELLTKNISNAVTNYHYDALGNLRSVGLPGGSTITYEVDGAGRRVGKLIDGKLTNGYLYRNARQLKAVTDTNGNVTAAFGYGPAQTPLTMRTATGFYRIITDDLGSVRLVVDPVTNTVLQRLSYDEFGRVTEDTNPGFQPFGYAGGLYDPDTGLVHFGARDYDPTVGRWTTKDPILLAGGFNLYLYVGNDPINATDVSGLLQGVPDWLLWLDDHGVLQGAGDFSAGIASALTFGLSDKLIGATGLGKYGSKCSGAYFGGHVGGMVLGIVEGPATLAESAGVEGVEAAGAAEGWLAEGEAAGGHLLERHVGRTAAELDARLADEVGLDAASSFDSVGQAAETLEKAVGENSGAIADWMAAGSEGRLVITTTSEAGLVRIPGGYSAAVSGARFVLEGNGAGSFGVLTGFPTAF